MPEIVLEKNKIKREGNDPLARSGDPEEVADWIINLSSEYVA